MYPDLDVDAQLAEFERRFSDDPANLLQFDTAKIYVDGILDLGTAALVEPYDEPVDPQYPSGFRYFRDDQLRRYVSALHDIGYRIHFHVIGDAATRAALDAVEAIDADPAEIAARRHRTTHTYLVHPDDVIARAGTPLVRLVPVRPPAKRMLGFLTLDAPDDAFDSLSDEDLAGWQ